MSVTTDYLTSLLQQTTSQHCYNRLAMTLINNLKGKEKGEEERGGGVEGEAISNLHPDHQLEALR